ncbi:MAG: ATP synthase F0 subunit A [Chloroflexi bacterium RBG_16_52_11]|nr:MAG: ATP synthase F0 subunit A [Chloroflexi bacterium RBG_16_52_11]
MHQVEKTRKWRWGVNRWFVLLFAILGFFAAQAYPPVLPHIQLPAEVTAHFGNFAWTNTMTAMVIGDVILLLIALLVSRAAKSGQLVPSGFSGAVEALMEVIYNLTESTAGRWAKSIFPFFAAITLLVLVSNWIELIPGVDSIGLIEKAHEGGHAVEQVLPGVVTIAPEEGEFALIPYVRVLSTDLNFTVALALTSVFMTQVFGVRALGPRYFEKFINVRGIFTRPIFGVIDFAVGLLEMISEFSKILSFSFRLFGNIFAGSVLLFVIGTLIPVFAQSGFLLLEFFVGLIQAFVFGMLTMVFMSQAVAGHGEHAEEHGH